MRAFLEDVITGKDRGVKSWLVRAPLWPLSVLYGIGLRVFHLPYSIGLRKQFRLSVPVISVGNITFGGTGKTPAVITICRMLRNAGLHVVVLSRGHGGAEKGPLVVSDGTAVLASAAESGDEPRMLAEAMPGVPVVSGRDRRLSGSLAVERFAPGVIVLDDGMQFWQLHRDVEVAVVSAERPFGSGFLMPAGDLREAKNALGRAGVVIVTAGKTCSVDALASLKTRLAKLTPMARIYEADHNPECLVRCQDGETIELEHIKGKRVLAFCGIGNPQSFLLSLERLGAVVARQMIWPDHFAYGQKDAKLIAEESQACEAQVVVTTEKDCARLGSLAEDIPDLMALRVNLEIERISDFAQHITDRIHQKDKEAPLPEAAH